MKIQELLPHLKKGRVAMDKDGDWHWYKRKPYYNLRNGFWRISPADSFPCRLPREALSIEFAGDWKDSLMECGDHIADASKKVEQKGIK